LGVRVKDMYDLIVYKPESRLFSAKLSSH